MAEDYSTPDRPGPGTFATRDRPGLRTRLAWLVVALAVAAGFARLGVWQLDRAARKIAAAALVAERARLPALTAAELARTEREAEAQWQRRAILQGRWRADRTVWLANRTQDGHPGFVVVTPLELGPGDAVLVQRGWVARDPVQAMKLPPLVTAAGTVTVTGHVAPWPPHWLELGAEDPAGSSAVRQNLDRAAFAAQTALSLRPVTVMEDASAANAGDGLGRRWPAPAVDVQRHYGYAAQWFAMSAACLGLYAWLALRRPRREPPEDP